MAMDSPLRRWRRSQHLTQRELAERCGVRFTTIARYEQRFRLPRGEQLEKLIEVTGLSADQLIRPVQYLREHPEFLIEWAEQPPSRGRPRRKRPPEA
jgi:transcriptional regulator with XRE-family HTH domain